MRPRVFLPSAAWWLLAGVGLAWLASAAGAAIDVALVQPPWPRERTRTFEVGKYPVQWRQGVDKTAGIFAGVRFASPANLQATWDLAQDYCALGQHTPGVHGVRLLEETAARQRIEVDVTVLWRKVTLQFLIEREAPHRLRFELLDSPLGAYRGYATFAQAPSGTAVELATQLQPSQRAPLRLLLFAERLAMLGGTRAFLRACEQRAKDGTKDGDSH